MTRSRVEMGWGIARLRCGEIHSRHDNCSVEGAAVVLDWLSYKSDREERDVSVPELTGQGLIAQNSAGRCLLKPQTSAHQAPHTCDSAATAAHLLPPQSFWRPTSALKALSIDLGV